MFVAEKAISFNERLSLNYDTVISKSV